MRIIIICGAGYISGKEKIMFSLLKGLAAEGDEVYCITSRWSNGQFEDLLIGGHINYSKMRLGFISKTLNWKSIRMTMDQLIYWPKLLVDYKRILSKFNPDVVIHTNFHHLFLLFPVIGSHKTINIYHSHESMGDTRFYKRLFNLFQKKIKLFVGVSAYVTDKLRNLGISNDKLKTIHNGLEIIQWKPTPLKQGAVFKIGIVGQVGRWKGHEDVLLALDILKRKYNLSQFKLCIFGTGDPLFIKELHKLIEEKHLNDQVEWKGFVKNIEQIYAGLQVVCIPSRSEEPFATSALEAGLYAVPVIVSNRGGFPEIVKHSYNGFIVEANAPAEIAKYLALMIEDRAMALQTGLNHQQIVNQSFSINNFISNWKSTLKVLTS